MSTKIYTGIKFKTKDPSELLKQLRSLKDPGLDIASTKIITTASVVMSCSMDQLKQIRLLRKNPKDKSSIYFDIYHAWIKYHDRFAIERYIPSVFFNVVIFFYEGDIYGIWYGSHHYKHLIMSIAEDFHYQNQTDAPENIPYEEFEARGKIWDKLIGWESVSLCGFTYDIIKENMLWSIDSQERKIQKAFYKALDEIIINIKDEEE